MYTREQLIEAMTEYNRQYEAEPEKFKDNTDWTAEQKAENQVEFLLSLVK